MAATKFALSNKNTKTYQQNFTISIQIKLFNGKYL